MDIERSTIRNNPEKARLRRTLYALVDDALRTSGITQHHHDPLVDRGDGLLILFRPCDDLPKTLLLSTFVPTLGRLLADHNGHHPDHRFRVRTAMHAGEVHYDRRGPFGEAVDVTCRLVDAPELKCALGGSAAALALVVSNDIHRSVVRHGYDGIDPGAFTALIRTEIAGTGYQGWVRGSVPELRRLVAG